MTSGVHARRLSTPTKQPAGKVDDKTREREPSGTVEEASSRTSSGSTWRAIWGGRGTEAARKRRYGVTGAARLGLRSVHGLTSLPEGARGARLGQLIAFPDEKSSACKNRIAYRSLSLCPPSLPSLRYADPGQRCGYASSPSTHHGTRATSGVLDSSINISGGRRRRRRRCLALVCSAPCSSECDCLLQSLLSTCSHLTISFAQNGTRRRHERREWPSCARRKPESAIHHEGSPVWTLLKQRSCCRKNEYSGSWFLTRLSANSYEKPLDWSIVQVPVPQVGENEVLVSTNVYL